MVAVLTTLLAAVLSACSTSTPPPAFGGAPILAVAHTRGADSAVAIFETEGTAADMQRTALLTMPNDLLAYSSVLGPNGDLYVATSIDGAIVIVGSEDVGDGAGPQTPAGATGRTFTSPDMVNPLALAFDGRGDLWVADRRNPDPSGPGPNRLLRFEDPSSIQDGDSVEAATILDLATAPTGFLAPRLVYAMLIDDQDRLWYTDYYGWSVGRIDDLAGRAASEADVVPDMQFVTWDPTDVADVAVVANPAGLALSDAGDLYLGSNDGDVVYRFDGAGAWTGFLPDVAPDASLDVGIAKPRFVALDPEGGLWALSNTDRKLARVEGHANGTGSVTLAPTRTLAWAPSGTVLGGGMRFAAAP